MAESSLINTGIEGLDEILLGGIPRKNVILVQGAAGTGKTLLGMEFIYRGIIEHNEPGLIVVFETSPDKLVRDAAVFGWDLEDLERQNKLKIIFTSPQVVDQELRSPDSLLLETAAEISAQRIFVDGIGLLRQEASNGNHAQHGVHQRAAHALWVARADRGGRALRTELRRDGARLGLPGGRGSHRDLRGSVRRREAGGAAAGRQATKPEQLRDAGAF